MNKIMKNTIIITLITLVAGVLLGLVYEITLDPIKASKEKAKQEAYKEVFDKASEFQEYADFDEKEAADVLKEAGLEGDIINEVVVAKDGSDDAGYVITVTSKEGYGGDIRISIGIQNDGMVSGVAVLSISETAGLGMKAAEPAFKNQFKEKAVEQYEVTKVGASSDEQIDALSGATITSNAMTNAVNAGLAYFQNVLGGGSANE